MKSNSTEYGKELVLHGKKLHVFPDWEYRSVKYAYSIHDKFGNYENSHSGEDEFTYIWPFEKQPGRPSGDKKFLSVGIGDLYVCPKDDSISESAWDGMPELLKSIYGVDFVKDDEKAIAFKVNDVAKSAFNGKYAVSVIYPSEPSLCRTAVFEADDYYMSCRVVNGKVEFPKILSASGGVGYYGAGRFVGGEDVNHGLLKDACVFTIDGNSYRHYPITESSDFINVSFKVEYNQRVINPLVPTTFTTYVLDGGAIYGSYDSGNPEIYRGEPDYSLNGNMPVRETT